MDLSNYQKTFTIKKGGSERGEILERFVRPSIKAYKAKKLTQLTISEIAVALAHIPTNELHAFYRECEGAQSFSRFFWWSLKQHPKWQKTRNKCAVGVPSENGGVS